MPWACSTALPTSKAVEAPSVPQGTRVEGMINKLFEGHTLNYLECINVDYKSSRKESFMDVQASMPARAGPSKPFTRSRACSREAWLW